MSGMKHDEFATHLLNEEGIKKAQAIRDVFDWTMDSILMSCPAEGREIKIVRTKLEEACFFAKKAMAKQPENQK